MRGKLLHNIRKMTVTELYSKMLSGDIDFLSAPFNSYQTSDYDYLDYLHYFCEKYVQVIRTIDWESIGDLNSAMNSNILEERRTIKFDLVVDIKRVVNMVEDAVVQYYKGFPLIAKERFEKAFTDNDCHLLQLLPSYTLHRNGDVSPVFYRMRNDRCSNPLELFHVPYEKRYLASYSRYSIAGYPSLYLSSSLEMSWHELDEPDLRDVSYSRYHITGSQITFIDLGLPMTSEHFSWNIGQLSEMYSVLVFYPLIMSCSLKVKHKGTYVPEYFVPQTMLEILRLHARKDGKIRGIAYPSTKASDIESFVKRRNRNFVIPTIGAEQRDGYCAEISTLFTMTHPIMFPVDYKGKVDIEALNSINEDAPYNAINVFNISNSVSFPCLLGL